MVRPGEMPVLPVEDTFIITGCLWLLGPVSFLWAVPNTHCQSLFSLSPVYLKWPCSKSWPFLSLDVLILWIKLSSWSQSSGYSHRPRRNVNVISSVLAEESCSWTQVVWRVPYCCPHLQRNLSLTLMVILNYMIMIFFSALFSGINLDHISVSLSKCYLPFLWLNNLYNFIILTAVNNSRDGKKKWPFQIIFLL